MLIKVIIILISFTLCISLFVACKSTNETGKTKIRILLTIGGHGFEEKEFYEMFDELPDISYRFITLPDSAALLKPGLEKQYDVIVMYDMVKSINTSERKTFVELLKKGIGIVALHHNLGAHRDWDEYVNIIGGKYIFEPQILDGTKHDKSTYAHDQDIPIKVVDKEHPITQGIADFNIHDETYMNYYTSSAAHVLLSTDHPESDPEIAWVNRYEQSPVFYLLLGHDSQAWKNPVYPKILLNGIHWAAQKVKEYRSKSNSP